MILNQFGSIENQSIDHSPQNPSQSTCASSARALNLGEHEELARSERQRRQALGEGHLICYREALRAEIADTVSDPDFVDDEIARLMAAVR